MMLILLTLMHLETVLKLMLTNTANIYIGESLTVTYVKWKTLFEG